MGSSQDPPPNVDSSDNSPKTMESSENRPLDSSENRPSDSSNNRPLDSSENRPKESSEKSPQKSTSSENQPLDSSDKLPQKSTSSENQPLDSSESNPQKSTSTENRPLDPTQNSGSSIIRPLDPLRKLNPLNKLDSSKDRHLSEEGEFPPWVTRHSRRLLARGPRNNGIRADVVVAKDGSGRCKTIAQALAMVPMKNTKKFVIHIKQGVYKEKVEVTKKMLHVMFVGDGPTKTIITGDIAFLPNQVGTYRTASVGKIVYNILHMV